MTNTEKQDPNDEIMLGDLFRPLIQYWRLIWQGSIAATVFALLLGALYFVFQPSAWSATISIRPVFEGADDGKYPNGLPFAPSDITDASVVAQVFARNSLEQYCSLEVFQNSLSMQTSSVALQFLTAEYQGRLSDARLNAVDRQRVQDEFAAKRESITLEYQLQFVRPQECGSLPQPVVLKVMTDVLATWATDSQTRRGVLKMKVAVLSPEVFTNPDASMDPLLVRADLVRHNVERIIQNIIDIEKLPGAELVRAGKVPISFAEVRSRFEDLLTARLEPLIGTAGRQFGSDSVRWINYSLKTAMVHLQAAETRAAAFRQAFREYSGVLSTPTATSGAADRQPQRSSDVQALTPQIDRTFVEGIVELSATNTEFRQELTKDVIEASLEVVSRASTVDYYRNLLAEMKESSGGVVEADDLEKKLAVLIAQAKDATQLLHEVYNEFSQVAFRADSALYRVEQPGQVTVLRAFSITDYALLIIGVLLGAPIILAMSCLVLFHLRRFVNSTVTF